MQKFPDTCEPAPHSNRIENHCNSTLMVLFWLHFLALPVWIDVPPKDTFAVVNETVEMECQGRGDPTPTITWKKDDVIINNATSSRYFFPKFTGSLTIMMSQKSDSAKYTCVVTNSFGSKWANATLTVLSKFVVLFSLC